MPKSLVLAGATLIAAFCSDLARAQLPGVTPAWAFGVWDCRIDGKLAKMTWKLEDRTFVEIVDGQPITRSRQWPVGMIQFAAGGMEELIVERGNPEYLDFRRAGGRTYLRRKPDGWLDGAWQCAPQGQQVPRLRSELQLQTSPLRRPGAAPDLTPRPK